MVLCLIMTVHRGQVTIETLRTDVKVAIGVQLRLERLPPYHLKEQYGEDWN